MLRLRQSDRFGWLESEFAWLISTGVTKCSLSALHQSVDPQAATQSIVSLPQDLPRSVSKGALT